MSALVESPQFQIADTQHIADQFIISRLDRLLNPCESATFHSLLDEIEAHMLDRQRFGLGGAECAMRWIHSEGVSTKEMILSPMAVVTGATHKAPTLNIVAKGEVSVFTERGPIHFSAGDVFTSSAGVRKMGFTRSGVKFLNVFPNPDNERDEAALADRYFEPPKAHEQAGEFECFKRICGLRQEQIDQYMEQAGEPLALECGSVVLRESPIQGRGLFAARDILKGEFLPVFINRERTQLARYSNHSFTPNMELVGVNAIALTNIPKGDEITMNYLDNFIKTIGNGGLQCLQD